MIEKERHFGIPVNVNVSYFNSQKKKRQLETYFLYWIHLIFTMNRIIFYIAVFVDFLSQFWW